MKTLKQVQELTGIKANTLRQRIFKGTLKSVKLGRDWFLEDEVIESLKKLRKYENPSP